MKLGSHFSPEEVCQSGRNRSLWGIQKFRLVRNSAALKYCEEFSKDHLWGIQHGFIKVSWSWCHTPLSIDDTMSMHCIFNYGRLYFDELRNGRSAGGHLWGIQHDFCEEFRLCEEFSKVFVRNSAENQETCEEFSNLEQWNSPISGISNFQSMQTSALESTWEGAYKRR